MLVLQIPLDLNPDTGDKSGRFFKALSKKSLELVLNKRDSIIIFNLNLMLLPSKVDPILEKQG